MLVEVQTRSNQDYTHPKSSYWLYLMNSQRWCWQQTMIRKEVTTTWPVRVWLEGRSNNRLFWVNIGLLAKADTSVDFSNNWKVYLTAFKSDRNLVLVIPGKLNIVDWNWKLRLFYHLEYFSISFLCLYSKDYYSFDLSQIQFINTLFIRTKFIHV